MPDTAEITLVLDENELRRLAELAGGESNIADYLKCLGLRVHSKKCAPGGAVDLEQAIIEIDDLLQWQQYYKQKIYTLQKQLGQALAKQRQLLAVVDNGSQPFPTRSSRTCH
jgi:hypothetical protein